MFYDHFSARSLLAKLGRERSVEVFQKVLRIPIATKTTDDCTTDEISAVVGSCTSDEVPGDSTIVAGDIPTAGGGDTVEPSLLSTASSKHGRRAGYTDEQETAIKTLFRDDIRTGIIHMPHTRSTMKAYPDMSECLNGYTIVQLKDKIRSIITKNAEEVRFCSG